MEVWIFYNVFEGIPNSDNIRVFIDGEMTTLADPPVDVVKRFVDAFDSGLYETDLKDEDGLVNFGLMFTDLRPLKDILGGWNAHRIP